MLLRILGRYLLLSAVLLALFPASSAAQENSVGPRLLNAEEGLAVVSAARDRREQARHKPDCSHLVHQIYDLAGFPYPYASSFDLYEGVESFRRVATPHAGDLVVWRGHAGIVIDPAQRSFYSSVRLGSRAEYYDGAYWRARGRPRFYRYIVGGASTLLAADSPRPGRISEGGAQAVTGPAPRETSDAPTPATSSLAGPEPVAASATRTPTADRPLEAPSSILVAIAGDWPTEDEIGESISELNSAAGNVLRNGAPVKPGRTVVIYDQLRVERLEIQGDRGWAHVQVDGRLLISGEKFERKHRREKFRWELRRTSQGWQLLAVPNRVYVPRDVAVRELAAQLALLTQNDAGSDSTDLSLRQQSLVVRALGLLFDSN
ncbi:MAG: hypothetical protein WBC04_22050 [Candidatus Acidiferrales bacterium]